VYGRATAAINDQRRGYVLGRRHRRPMSLSGLEGIDARPRPRSREGAKRPNRPPLRPDRVGPGGGPAPEPLHPAQNPRHAPCRRPAPRAGREDRPTTTDDKGPPAALQPGSMAGPAQAGRAPAAEEVPYLRPPSRVQTPPQNPRVFPQFGPTEVDFSGPAQLSLHPNMRARRRENAAKMRGLHQCRERGRADCTVFAVFRRWEGAMAMFPRARGARFRRRLRCRGGAGFG
jgi:hypothetical protein